MNIVRRPIQECGTHRTVKGDQRRPLLVKGVLVRGGGWSPAREGQGGMDKQRTDDKIIITTEC